jgi:hypothetical protein
MRSGRGDAGQARRGAILAAVLLIGIGHATAALAWSEPVGLRVVDRDTGRVLPVWRHDGRLYVAGEPGARYGLRVTNHSEGRVLVVMSVDGVNILTGETASWDERGYVLGPHQTYDVNGWRKSLSEVADFTFAPLPQSYAARTGRPDDVGVIGLAVFAEREYAPPPPVAPAAPPRLFFNPATRSPAAPPPPPAPVAAQARAAPAPTLAAGAERRMEGEASLPEEKLGTAHGAREWSATNVVAFERATPYPQCVLKIDYDSYDNLVASGVIHPTWGMEHQPRAFPGSPDGGGFVPDPPDEP